MKNARPCPTCPLAPSPCLMKCPKNVVVKKKVGLKRSPMKKVSLKRQAANKTYSESDLYNEIWAERKHFSELTGEPLLPKGHYLWHAQFLHILNKGRFSSLRLRKRNILLALPSEHERQEEYSIFQERKAELKSSIYDTRTKNS